MTGRRLQAKAALWGPAPVTGGFSSVFSAVPSNGSAMVRVLSISTAERTLLKGFTGGVADLAFAHLNSNQLACLDEAGNLFVWRLAMDKEKIQYPVKLHLMSGSG